MRSIVCLCTLLLLAIHCGQRFTPKEPTISAQFILPTPTEKKPKMTGWDWGSKTKPYEWTEHAYGYIGPATGSEPIAIQPATAIAADTSLSGKAVKVTLDRLVAYDYPGSGLHNVLINFYAQNQSEAGVEEVNFNQTFRIQEGSAAGISGYPVFRGLIVGDQGIAFRFFTVNVSNDSDVRMLKILDSDATKGGIQLGLRANPALKPLADISIGLAKLVLERNEKRPVQDVYMGLDFSTTAALRVRLREGSYIVVQVKDQASWDWTAIQFNPATARLERKDKPEQMIENNYFVFSVTK